MFINEPFSDDVQVELEYYKNTEGSIIGTICLDRVDSDFTCIILCRDEHQVFRCIDLKVSLATLKEAQDWIVQKIRWFTHKELTTVSQGAPKVGLNLFEIKSPGKNRSADFDSVCDRPSFYPAKKVIQEVSKFFQDIDGNFVEQFQSSNGFDARLWELYLYCFFTELKFLTHRVIDSTDFNITKHQIEIYRKIIPYYREFSFGCYSCLFSLQVAWKSKN